MKQSRWWFGCSDDPSGPILAEFPSLILSDPLGSEAAPGVVAGITVDYHDSQVAWSRASP